jgi:hypothetical protein
VSDSGLKADPKMIQAITSFPSPNDPNLSVSKRVAHCLQFVGLSGFYRRFADKLSSLEAPLCKLALKDTPWLWEAPQENAYQVIKRIMSSAPVLAFADFSLPENFRAYMDASQIGLGGVLTQVDRVWRDQSTSHLEFSQDLKKTAPRLHLNTLALSTLSLFSTSTWLVGSLSCIKIIAH